MTRPRQPAVSAPPSSRLWEVDALRPLAILMMVAYHAGYDVDQLAPGVGVDALGGRGGPCRC